MRVHSASGQGADDENVVCSTLRRSDTVSGAEWPHPEGFWRFSSIASLLRVAVGKTTASLSRLALKENRSERGLEASIEIGSMFAGHRHGKASVFRARGHIQHILLRPANLRFGYNKKYLLHI